MRGVRRPRAPHRDGLPTWADQRSIRGMLLLYRGSIRFVRILRAFGGGKSVTYIVDGLRGGAAHRLRYSKTTGRWEMSPDMDDVAKQSWRPVVILHEGTLVQPTAVAS